MSYSISIRVAAVGLAAAALSAEFDKIVAQQPIHEADRAQALAVTEAYLGLIREPGEGEEISISLSGWVSTRGVEAEAFTSAAVSVQVSVVQTPSGG